MSFVPYQVDYSVKNTAKTLGFSKKKVTFKFGFANQVALDENSQGPACRGSEHDVTFVWSLKTGKRQLFLDGKEVHFSESGLNGWTNDRTWQYAFGMRDTTVGARNQLKVHFISQPVNRDIPDSRPFDLRIAGISYFQFNQIFQLGTPTMTIRGGGSRSGRPSGDDGLSAEERRLIEQAKMESLKELEETKKREAASANSMSHNEASLIDFGEPTPAPPQQQPPLNTVAPQPQFTSALTLDTAIDEPNAPSPWGQQSPAQQQQPAYGGVPNYGYQAPGYGTAPPPGQQHLAPAPYSAPAPFNTNMALAPYQPPAGQPAPSPYAMPPAAPPAYGYPPPQQQQQQQQQPYQAAAPPPPPQGMMSPSVQSTSSFGSAPSFAQPPKPPPRQQSAPAFPGYGAPSPPSQQQQQQQQQAYYPQQQSSYY